ncbi:T9SS type A sorting domain-containing protein [Belliella sp. R4-6]|uniref:T9SS type A sorting domain-containing protein n=1 Tax=Belliella alkalica TaxID=1730871 RepID=A0ABS9VCZ3_9BACT|nr:T9SS type A sorting domain-containing protein [Belliella alkalica]MCH7414297.1 T9SS type A sorting domain-containing protein [Belliella alkalica]
MNSNQFKILFVTLILISISVINTFGQFQQIPTPKKNVDINIKSARKSDETKLTLPFWDDFSKSEIRDDLWINSGVTHSFSAGNLPPSLGVAVFDGIGNDGRPYETNPINQGFTDRLESRPFDLTGLSDQEKESVYISFFWQAGGKGELPDSNDQISLQFLNNNGDWTEIWSQTGNLIAEQFFFTQETIKVTEEFQHEAFQFRFLTRGRASGPFDTWLIDYVYLNKNRTSTNLNFRDRTLTGLNTPIFEKYSSIPLFELQANSEKYLSPISNEFNNLENRFRAMEFTVELREKESNELVLKINNNTPINPVPLALERRQFTSNQISNIPVPEEEGDLELVTYLSSGDEILFQIVGGDTLRFPEVDFRINDTARTTIAIRDYFAYDNGSLDYSAGINQRSGMLAQRFEKTEDAYLKGISINFSNFTQFGRGVDIMVWNNLSEDPIYVKESVIPQKDVLEEFSYFEIDENILLEDVFYVGFMQFTNDFIYVGLDKSKDNGEEIFFNVTGTWQQNELVSGSLMIRSHLSSLPPFEQIESNFPKKILIYPNPVVDYLMIEGNFELIQVLDPYGRAIKVEINDAEKGKILNFAGTKSGLYLINVLEQGEPKSYRILVK